jgi:DNA polymerase-3 subunit alpha
MEILPPDVSESGVDFRIQGTAIRFSIGHVKNVATAAEAIETMQPFTSIEDFHNRVKATVTTKTGKVREQKLNKKVFESLLYAGAFDKFGTRNEVAAEYSRLRKKKGEEPIELTDDEWLDKEREVIGLVLSVEPMVKKYAALVKAMGAQTIGEEATRKKVRLFGRIASMTPHTSRNGNSMFKVYFEDGIDSIMFFVFEGGKQRFRDEFKIGDVGLMPLGRFDDGGQRFFDDNGPCKVFTKEELEDAEAGRLPQDENQDAG